jgi:hypothetical protein
MLAQEDRVFKLSDRIGSLAELNDTPKADAQTAGIEGGADGSIGQIWPGQAAQGRFYWP